MRWSETYGLPVHRIARGGKPLVFALQPEIDAWWKSTAGAAARGDSGPVSEPCSTEGLASESVNLPDTSGGVAARRPQARGIRRQTLLAGAALLIPALGLLAWFTGSAERSSLVWRLQNGARGGARSATGRVSLVAHLGGADWHVRAMAGDLMRVETANGHYGLQASVEGARLRLNLCRLETVRGGESVTHLATHDMSRGEPLGLGLGRGGAAVLWPGTGGEAKDTSPPREACCMVCGEVTVCGETVIGPCGRCQGDPKK